MEAGIQVRSYLPSIIFELIIICHVLLPNVLVQSSISHDRYGFVKYLPKVMFVIDLALTSSAAACSAPDDAEILDRSGAFRVQFAAISLLYELCSRLSGSMLAEHVPCIAISLYPVLQVFFYLLHSLYA